VTRLFAAAAAALALSVSAAGAATVTYSSLAAYDAAQGPSTVAENFNGNTLNGTVIQQITGPRSFANNRLQGVAGGATGNQTTTIIFTELMRSFAVNIANLGNLERANVLLDGVQVATIQGGSTFFGIFSTIAFGSISFVDATLPTRNTQFAIDNVRVSAVPLPAAGLGLAGALVLLAAARRRKAA
jgi:hypothetical protein